MKQKSTNELIGHKGHFFDFIVFLPIPVGKSNPAVINGDDPVVWYSNTVSVTAKILKHLLGACKGAFCIGDPTWFWNRVNQLLECVAAAKGSRFLSKNQLPSLILYSRQNYR